MTKLRNTPDTNDDEDDAVPLNLDEFWRTLCRRLADSEGHWRTCASPRCRRTKRCVDARLLCTPEGPVSPMTEEQSAEARASLRKALDDEMRRRGIVR